MPLDGTVLPTVGDDLASTDEVKVFKDEGDDENRENLSEDKLGLVSETEAGKCSVIEHAQFLIDGQTRLDCSFLSYSSGNRFSFGYPLVTPYPYPYGSIDLRGLALTAGGFPFYLYNSNLFPASVPPPPPAHIRLPVPWHLGSHRSFASHQASMYGLVSPTPRVAPNPNFCGRLRRAQTPPVYGIPSPYRQFPHSFCHSELPNSIGWGGSTMSLPCPYPACQLPEIGPMISPAAPPAASLPLPPLSARISSYSGMSLTAAVQAACEPRHSLDVRSFSNHRTVFLSRHSHQSRLTRQQGVLPSVSGNPFHSATKVPHIKKPLNAFMIFMKDMRKKVIDECTLKESAAINQILGRRWHALDRKEQAKYYEMARKEKEHHRQLYPTWSARDNYAIHSQKKRRRTQMHHEEKSTNADDGRECLNAKKCRARFGLDRQSQWCKPCRRKKRCIRFMRDGDENELRWTENPFRGVRLPPDSTSERLSSVPEEDSEIRTQAEETRQSVASSSLASEGDAKVSLQILSKSLSRFPSAD